MDKNKFANYIYPNVMSL